MSDSTPTQRGPLRVPEDSELDLTNEELGQAFAKIQQSLQKMRRAIPFAGDDEAKYLPVTRNDHSDFETDVDEYERQLRAFLADWADYIVRLRLVVSIQLQITNDGGAPAEDARIKLYFPDPCYQLAERPERPKIPRRPKFERKLNPLHPSYRYRGLGISLPPGIFDTRIPNVRPLNLSHSGPHYEDGSLKVSYDYRSLPHHETIILDPCVVAVPEPGVYEVRWTIGAKNLAHLEEGSLQLEVKHEQADTAPITTLQGVVKARQART
jgi:hypothetical protein